jgi:Tol biopolymer transport system component
MNKIFRISLLCLLVTGCGGDGGSDTTACTTLDCQTSKYNLLLADVDFTQASPEGSNIRVIARSSFQDMTHPRVSPDKNWLVYTTYNVTNTEGCASTDSGYVNTEIKATRLDGSQTQGIIAVTDGTLNSNNYWYGGNYEFTFLSGAPGSTKIYRAQTAADMNLVAGPSEVTVPATILPIDPQAISDTQLVYVGVYDNAGLGLAKSVFLQSLNPPGTPVGLTLGRDSAGTILYGNDVMENDPKLSLDGSKVAFMRQAPNSGANGFGWRIFVVPVANALNEVNISAALGTSLLNNDALPEWVDNNTLVFANIDSTVTFNTRTIWLMGSDGTNRRRVTLPEGYRYSDVYPFLDSVGNQKIIVSAEKIAATCVP